MEIIIILIPIALILTGIAFWAFFWSVNSGQFDDLESPAHSILYDDDDHLIPDDAKVDKDLTSPSDADNSKHND